MIHHSDRGSQYVGIRYSERLAEAGIATSVGNRGDSYDNALAETINGLYKAELIHRRGPWKTRESFELATLEWVAWFNHHRLLESIGYIPPAEAEANYYSQFTSIPVMAAQLKPNSLRERRAVHFNSKVSTVAFESTSYYGVKLVCLVISRTAGMAESVDSHA